VENGEAVAAGSLGPHNLSIKIGQEMRWWTSSLLALLIAASPPAQGQDILSDTELFAAYCIGHFNRLLQEVQAVDPCVMVPGSEVSCRKLNDLKRQGIEGVSADQSRLKRYLIARGVFTVRKAPLILAGVTAATRQGEADTEVCYKHLPELDCKSTPDAQDCVLRGSERWPECVQMKRCNDLSRVPF
jgi:hypothetical protein